MPKLLTNFEFAQKPTSTAATLAVHISGIAGSTTEDDLNKYLAERDLPLSDEHGPIIFTKTDNYGRKRTTITLDNDKTFKRANSLTHTQRILNGSVLVFDSKFLGFTVLSEGTEVDIVALHGMNGHAFTSFEHREDSYSFMWLRDALPNHIPGARIMTYGYDADVVSDVSEGRIRTYAEMFMLKLRLIRKNTSRPLILIGHALGGLIIKQALILQDAEGLLEPIINSVRAVIFMATPHQGMRGIDDQIFIDNFFGASGVILRRELIAEQAKTIALFDLTNDFKELIARKKIRIRSLYETWKTKVEGLGPVLIVDEQSSRLGIAGEQVLGLNADHLNLCKFSEASENLNGTIKITEELAKAQAQDLPPAYSP